MALSNDDLSITWTSYDAPLWTVSDVVRGRWPRDFHADNGMLLSWVMNNYWWTNFPPTQSGSLVLRYAFTPGKTFDPAAAAQFGRSVRTPLIGHTVTWFDKMDTSDRRLPAAGQSMLDVDAPEHIAVTVASARVGDGLLVRIQELAGRSGSARITHPHGPGGSAWHCTALEDPLEPIAVQDGAAKVNVGPYEVVSFHLRPAEATP